MSLHSTGSSSFVIPDVPTSGLSRAFQPPPVELIGCYSSDPKQNYIDGAENLRYVNIFRGTKSVNYNVNEGIDHQKYAEDNTELHSRKRIEGAKLANLLKWINCHENVFAESRPDFVLLHGLLGKIVTTPYRCNYNTEWSLRVTRKNGTFYIFKNQNKQEVIADFRTVLSSWGRKFENFVLLNEPNQEPEPNKKVPLGSECHSVLKTSIGGHSILYAAELQGVCAKEGYDLLDMNLKENLDELANCRMVKVKSCSKSQHCRPQNFQRNKSRVWWVQAALGGISNLIIGYRNDKTGIVEEVENMPLTDLYKYGVNWYGESGYTFVTNFFSKVKELVEEDERVYNFSYSIHDQNQVGKETRINFEVPEDGSVPILADLL